MVDDAHNLDPLSATLVYQLARAGAARLVVTVASEAEPPDAIAALWSDDLLTRVAIEPLDRAQTAAFVESALDATLDVADADELFRRSLGNPLYLRHLIDGGGLEHVDGRWRCRDEDRRPLSGVIDEYLCALPEPARAVVDYLAIAEPLARTDLVALVGGEQLDTLGQAEAAGAVRVGPDSDTSEIFVGHPLYADRARAVLTAEHAHALRVSLVAQLAKHPSDHVSDQLRLSSLAIDVPASATPPRSRMRRPQPGRPCGSATSGLPNGWRGQRWIGRTPWRHACPWLTHSVGRVAVAKLTRCWRR